MVSVRATQPCCHEAKAALDNISTKECGCVSPKKPLFRKTSDGLDLAPGPCFADLCSVS